MGDGPGYDYMYDKIDRANAEKLRKQRRRFEILSVMLREVGFGNGDGPHDAPNDALEKIIGKNLCDAHTFLTYVIRSKTHDETIPRK